MSQNSSNGQVGGLDRRVLRETAQIVNSRTATWAVGTSLLFESVIVAFAAWIFCRRDY